MKSFKYKIAILFVLFAFLTISCSSKCSEGENNTDEISELDSFLDKYGFETENSENEEGELPLELALMLEDYEIAELLIDAGANPEILYILDISRAGLFESGMTKEEVEKLSKLYGEIEIEEVDLMAEGMSTPALELTFENETSKTLILQLSEMDFTICRIEIYSDKFKTNTGIGIGSTFSDIVNNYWFDGPFWGDQGDPVIIVEEINMTFALEAGDWWQGGETVGEVPGDTKIIKIFTW